jgi:6-phosphofructokinase 1
MPRSTHKADSIRRVAILFSGGPAPAANAVISAAAVCFLNDGREVLGFLGGYENLQHYHRTERPLLANRHYRELKLPDVTGLRNSQGVVLGTSRANPGKAITRPGDLDNPEKTALLRNIYSAFVDLGIDALISIGGDDTLKTANFLVEFQTRLPQSAKRVRIIHLPKTIDNDYEGIDFTFGFFTAVDALAREVRNLYADAAATSCYYIVESMGRKAGWLSYGVGVAGEADLIFSLEDIADDMTFEEETTDPKSGTVRRQRRLHPEALIDRIVQLILSRERRENKRYGVVVLAEGLAEAMPESFTRGTSTDEHGHIAIGRLDFGKSVARMVADEYERRTGKKKKVTGIQVGYEGRCASPTAFDVLLGCQIGVGGYRALVEENLDGHMVSVGGQLDLSYVPFKKLVNPETLITRVRLIRPGSDFHRLARFLESPVDASTQEAMTQPAPSETSSSSG